MPKIVINEQEDVSLATFDVTENAVLVPMLYVRDYSVDSAGEFVEYTEAPVSAIYTSATEFKTKCATKHVWIDTDFAAPDKSYVMIYELLLQGLTVVVKPIIFDNRLIDDDSKRVYLPEDSVRSMVEEAIIDDGAFDEFKDRNLWNIKFITSGAYPNCGIVGEDSEAYSTTLHTTLATLASDRGDAIAMIEFRKDLASETKEDILEELANVSANSYDKFSNAMFPWCNFTTSVMNTEKEYTMPASFAYLMAYANSVKTNANWFAAAGVIRGAIPNLVAPLFDVGEDLMHILQGDEGSLQLAINPIYDAGTYGYRIWGNRVMEKSNSSTENMFMNYLNVRILLCDIKKQIYHAAMRTTFEPNDDIVWINFKTLCNTLLDKMKSGRGIKWYKWTKGTAEEKGTIKATLAIRPIEAVDSFDITVNLSEGDASIEEASA